MASYLVIGLGRFGRSVAKTLYDYGKDVLAIDSDEETVQEVIDSGIIDDAIILNATEENALSKVVKDNFDVACVCIGSDMHASILVTLMLKEMGIKTIICKAKTRVQGKVLMKVGATEVIYPEESMGEKLAIRVMNPNLTEHFKFSKDYSILEFKTPEHLIGKNLIELDLRKKYGVNVIGIKTENEALNVTPTPTSVLERNSMLLVIANNSKMQILNKLLVEK